MKFRVLSRLLTIQRVLIKHGLDDIILAKIGRAHV